MPIIDSSDYKPPVIFKSGHLNTIYPYLFRNKIEPDYQRVRFTTKDNDFIHLDTLISHNKKLMILCHGLEGSSNSQYIRYMSDLSIENNIDVIAMNHRSCSGVMNTKLAMYHSGFTDDLHEVVETYKDNYDSIVIMGFSLGANVALKYANDGVFPVTDKLKVVIAVSVPVDLASSGDKISEPENILYSKNFLYSLMSKMDIKAKEFPDQINKERLKKVKSIRDFDNFITGPIHGFKDGADYYERCSSKPFLHKSNIPTLIINAQDDPFLDKPSYPFEIAEDNRSLFFLAPKFGGHVGFATFGDKYYWHEKKSIQFINEHI